MLKIFNRKKAVNGVIFIKSIKDLNTVINVAKDIGKECKRRGLNVEYCFLDTSEDNVIERKAIKQFLDEMQDKNLFALGFACGCAEITQRANGRAVHPEYFGRHFVSVRHL